MGEGGGEPVKAKRYSDDRRATVRAIVEDRAACGLSPIWRAEVRDLLDEIDRLRAVLGEATDGDRARRQGAAAMKCDQCAGDGWYAGHHPECYGRCRGRCPVQVQCERCRGTGRSDDERAAESDDDEVPF